MLLPMVLPSRKFSCKGSSRNKNLLFSSRIVLFDPIMTIELLKLVSNFFKEWFLRKPNWERRKPFEKLKNR